MAVTDEEIIRRLRAFKGAGTNLSRTAANRMERLRTDAARYQYLRNRPEDTIGKGGVFAGITPPTGSGGSILTEEDLDRAIDAALAPDQTGGK